jgi:hypothetical protein
MRRTESKTAIVPRMAAPVVLETAFARLCIPKLKNTVPMKNGPTVEAFNANQVKNTNVRNQLIKNPKLACTPRLNQT